MSYFSNIEVNIGEVKVGSKVKAVFRGKDNMPEIDSLRASCSCTNPEYNEDNNTVSSIITVPKFSKHIVDNTQGIQKSIIVTYKTGEQDVLYIKGTKIR